MHAVAPSIARRQYGERDNERAPEAAAAGQPARLDALARPAGIVGPARWYVPTGDASVNLTADTVRGDTSVQLTSTVGFVAGQYVLLDELDDRRAFAVRVRCGGECDTERHRPDAG